MPWIMSRARSDQSRTTGAADAAHHLRVAALVHAVLGPRTRDSPWRTPTSTNGTSRPGEVARDPVAVRVPGEVADDVLAPREDREQRLVVVDAECR